MPHHIGSGGGVHSPFQFSHHHRGLPGVGGHHHHRPSHHRSSFISPFPFLFFGRPLQHPSSSALQAPAIPPNAVLSLSTSLETSFEIRQQYHLPTEAEGYLQLSELNHFISYMNDLLRSTAPKQLLLVGLNLLMIGIGVYFFLWIDDEGYFSLESFFLGIGLGFLLGQFFNSLIVRWFHRFRNENISTYLNDINERVFVRRGCHW
jgi:hypothetical protein